MRSQSRQHKQASCGLRASAGLKMSIYVNLVFTVDFDPQSKSDCKQDRQETRGHRGLTDELMAPATLVSR